MVIPYNFMGFGRYVGTLKKIRPIGKNMKHPVVDELS
jgi:hypothetical protein